MAFTYDGIPFRKANNVVLLPQHYLGHGGKRYFRFGRICDPSEKFSILTEFINPKTNKPVYAREIPSDGWFETNFMVGTNRTLYLYHEGQCYSSRYEGTFEISKKKEKPNKPTLAEFFVPGETEIWYLKAEQLAFGLVGEMPDLNNLEATHSLLGTVQEENLDNIRKNFQKEKWSPRSEAKDLIVSLGLDHISMKHGDVIILRRKKRAYLVQAQKFLRIDK